MAWPKGRPRPPGAGRAKGTKNKRDQTLHDKAAEIGVDPFEIMLLFAKNDWKALGYSGPTRRVMQMGRVCEVDVIEPEIRLMAAKEAAQYLHPRLRSVEVNLGLDQGPIVVNLNLSNANNNTEPRRVNESPDPIVLLPEKI